MLVDVMLILLSVVNGQWSVVVSVVGCRLSRMLEGRTGWSSIASMHTATSIVSVVMSKQRD